MPALEGWLRGLGAIADSGVAVEGDDRLPFGFTRNGGGGILKPKDDVRI
jgi:hypothetical protein